MTAEILKKIRDAESEASAIKTAAAARARTLRSDAEAAGKKLLEETKSRSMQERERVIAEAASESDSRLRSLRAAASNEIKDLSEKAESRMSAAADEIIKELFASCQ